MAKVKEKKSLDAFSTLKSSNIIKESYPNVGIEGNDYGWTSLSQDDHRDLDPMTQDRMQDIAFYLYDSNPLAHRIIEMTKDFITGDGFTFKAEDPEVQKILENHWNDPVNNWDLKQDQRAFELCLFGEQFYPVFVNPWNGHVKLGYIEPTRIYKVVLDKQNPEIMKEVILKANRAGIQKRYKVVNPNNAKGSENFGLFEGDIFVFNINKVTNATRGRSDLLALADWIDGYDQFLFARLERASLLNNYIWDVLLEDANEDVIKKFLENQSMPKPGSIRAHNQKVTWNAVAPKFESSDASKEANLFKMQILGGAGFPNLWFGEGGETIRAGAAEMSLPTLKHLQNRQKYFKYLIKSILQFQIDQAIIAKKISRGANTKFVVLSPPIAKKLEMQLGVAVGRISDSLKIAVESDWITTDQASIAFKTFMKEVIGVDFGGIKEPEKSEEPENKTGE